MSLAILHESLETGAHDLPCSEALRCPRNLGSHCLALIARAAQAFDGDGAINKPCVSKRVCQRLGDRVDRRLNPSDGVVLETIAMPSRPPAARLDWRSSGRSQDQARLGTRPTAMRRVELPLDLGLATLECRPGGFAYNRPADCRRGQGPVEQRFPQEAWQVCSHRPSRS